MSADWETGLWEIYTDGSVKDEELGSAFVVYFEGRRVYSEGITPRWANVPPNMNPVLYCEIVALHEAMSWLSYHKLWGERIELRCDNPDAIRLTSNRSRAYKCPEQISARRMVNLFAYLRVIHHIDSDNNPAHYPSRLARNKPGCYLCDFRHLLA